MSFRIIPLALLTGLVGAPAWAQGPYVPPNPNPNNPFARPVVSPYINLFRTNNPAIAPGINFLGITRPEFQLYGDVGQLQRQVTSLQTAATGPDVPGGLPGTGHPVAFQNLSHYYPGGSGTAPGAGAGRRPGAVTPTFPQGSQHATTGATPPRGR